nr:hypothetical protein Iba_chr04bCG3430 [Ipomoea batatas]
MHDLMANRQVVQSSVSLAGFVKEGESVSSIAAGLHVSPKFSRDETALDHMQRNSMCERFGKLLQFAIGANDTDETADLRRDTWPLTYVFACFKAFRAKLLLHFFLSRSHEEIEISSVEDCACGVVRNLPL